MIKTNLVAWTPAENNPPYLSINYLSSIDGAVEISIRERGKDNKLGNSVSVILTQDEFNTVLADIKRSINCNKENKLLTDKQLKLIYGKRCSRCKETKPTSDFPKNKSCADGFNRECKLCAKNSHAQ